ncbi:MAG: hypothetical protein Q9161_005998 [Pseudevernia consocians]
MTSNPAQNDAGPSNPAPNDAGPSNPAQNDAGTSFPARNGAGTSIAVRNEMGTSYFAQTESLSQETLNAYQRFFHEPRNAEIKLDFYFCFLADVVPYGITVHHFLPSPRRIPRYEIQLQTPSRKIFMSGLVAMEVGFVVMDAAAAAAAEASVQWNDRQFVPDGENWRCFIGIGPALIGFYKALGAGQLWEDMSVAMRLDPRGVAIYLQKEYDSLPPASRF